VAHRITVAAVRATYIAFIGHGFAFANWAARIPQVRDRLHLTPAALGLVLLAIAAGSLIALPLAGVIVHRFSARRTVAAMALLVGIALIIVAAGYQLGVVPVLVGLSLFGFSSGAWDVAMNVHAAAAERRVGRSIMPRFHAGWSIGTVAGALFGSAMVALHIAVTAHLLIVAVIVATVVPSNVRRFLPDTEAGHAVTDPPSASSGALRRWREPRTLLIGLFVLAFAFAEGTGNDWISVALIDGYDAPAVVGTLGFATFLTAMTATRWFGPGLLDRYGRVRVLRSLAIVAVIGLVVFVFGGAIPLAFVGVLLWGIGTSLGFPVGMSAAADDPVAAATRVSVVASIAYCAFLGGPPLIGFLGNQITVLRALMAVAVLLGVALMIADCLRPLRTDPAGARPSTSEQPRGS
jgi:fucose permease